MAATDSGRGARKLTRSVPRSKGRRDSGDAFIREPQSGPVRVDDDLAKKLACDFLGCAVSAHDEVESTNDEVVPEELGGPFVTTSGKTEFGKSEDPSNPVDAEVVPFPSAVATPDDDEDRDDVS